MQSKNITFVMISRINDICLQVTTTQVNTNAGETWNYQWWTNSKCIIA